MVTRGELARGDLHLVLLDPTVGSGIRKTRPCVVVSPNELNRHLRTAIVAPLTTGGRAYPWRIPCRFQRRAGFVALDQIRTVDVDRLSARLGRLASRTLRDVLQSLQEMFAAQPVAELGCIPAASRPAPGQSLCR